jgi:DNA-binding transcriptional LysR family regulator
MRLSDLETLAAAVQEGSLTAAARRLFLTQPAVSVRLRRLEEEVGEPLLQRTARGVRSTAAGERLYLRALALLDEVRRLEEEVSGRGQIRGKLAIGATDIVAIYHLPAALRRFRSRHGECEISLRVEGTASLLRLLEGGQCELVLGTFPIPEARFQVSPLYRDPLVILAPPGHRFVLPAAPEGSRRGRRRLSPELLAREVWISHKADSITRQLVDGFFAAHGLSLRVEMEISSPEAIKKMVQARLGLAVLPLCSVRREVAEGRLALLSVRGFRLERISGLILRRDAPLSRAAAAFREALGG